MKNDDISVSVKTEKISGKSATHSYSILMF